MTLLTKLLMASALCVAASYTYAQNPSAANDTTAYTITTRSVQGFDKLRLQGPFNVYITQGTEETLKLEAPAEILSRIVTNVNGNTLNIHNKHDNWGQSEKSWYSEKSWWRKHKRVTVYVTAKSLERISISGSGMVYFKDGLTAESLKLRVVGSGKMDGKIAVKTLKAHMSGSGHIDVAGNAGKSRVKISGSGHFSGGDLVTVNSSVHVSGSGRADINASENINALIRGSAHVSYTGSAKMVTSSKSGSGSVSRL